MVHELRILKSGIKHSQSFSSSLICQHRHLQVLLHTKREKYLYLLERGEEGGKEGKSSMYCRRQEFHSLSSCIIPSFCLSQVLSAGHWEL